MRGLFCFDGPMYKDKNGVYCNTTITSEMFSRYFNSVDKLIVIIRTFHLDKTYKEASLMKVELEGLEFIEIQNLNSVYAFLFKKNKYNNLINREVKKADLIFARMPSLISNITINIAINMGKPYMVEVGGCAWDSFWNHGLRGKIIAPYMFFKEVRGVRHASFASYVTENWLQSRYPCKCQSISASNVYVSTLKQEVLDKRLNKISKEKRLKPFVIGTIAAVNVRYKGQEYIIKAISKLNKDGFNFEYELVGSGDNSYLKGLVKKLKLEKKVKFKGLLLHNDVFDWLDSIDIYAQPSKQEGLPRALIEAMSRGCPAIGSRTAGIPELLDKSVIFENADVDNICTILIKLVSKDLTNHAIINFNKAKEFELDKLEKKRNKIYEEYKNYVEKLTHS